MAKVAELRPAAAPGDYTRDVEAEQSLIGAVLDGAMQGRDVLADIGASTLADAFSVREHGELWGILLDLDRTRQPLRIDVMIDAIRRSEQCPSLRASDLVDWAERVTEWWGAPTLARHYADRVRAAHARRQLIGWSQALATAAKADHRALSTWLPDQTAPLFGLRIAEQARLTLAQEVATVVSEIDERADGHGIVGIPSGIGALDRLLGGFHRGHIVVIAGRTGHGKTSLALTIAHHALRTGIGVGVVSCEMSRSELIERLIAQYMGLDVSQIKRGYLSTAARRQVHEAAAVVAEWPLQIEDRERQWPAVEIVLRRMVGNGAQLLVVDYLGLLHLPGKLQRWEQIAMITGDLKRLAVLLQVPILVLCQINREVAREKDKRPALWHLRDSGAVEQDADAVILLHRPSLVGEGFDREHAEAIVGKHRHGPTGTVSLRWIGAQTMFTDGVNDAWDQP